MRLGKWIKVFDRIVPIPMTLAASFGLREGSELSLAPMRADVNQSFSGVEIIVSPIPTSSWRTVCRLSVRLHDQPHALARATSFLREKRINILLTEAAATFQERAHWDAVCDLRAYPEYAPMLMHSSEVYESEMERLLVKLSDKIRWFAEEPDNAKVFLSGPDQHALFSPLSGLNHASFRCDLSSAHTVKFHKGGIELPDKLVRQLQATLGSFTGMIPPVPPYALITGATEQRYLRLYFIHDVKAFFMALVEYDISKLAGDGIGTINQFLMALPEQVNLLRLANYISQNKEGEKKGYIHIIGHWSGHDEAQLRRHIDVLELEDIDGVKHLECVRLVEFSTPRIAYPRVFISYSTKQAAQKLTLLRNKLIENNFEPVVGTEVGDVPSVGGRPVSSDVTESAFQKIPTCVAFISLQTKRDDFRQKDSRFVLPPWTVAEEVFAWTRGVPFLARLREHGVEDPRYNRNVRELVFDSDNEYEVQVIQLMHELNAYRQGDLFANALKAVRQSLYKEQYSPD